MKEVKIEYLYLDLNTCDRCMGTDRVLEEVVAALTPALELAGYRVAYSKIEMSTPQLAEKYGFVSSPTIKVNGHDICGQIKENSCAACSDIGGTAINCRVYTYEGRDYEVPPAEMLAQEILKVVFASSITYRVSPRYALPQNLRDFYNGKKAKSSCCSDGCCSDGKCC